MLPNNIVLPWGLKTPVLFTESLARDLCSLQLNQGVLLKYVDDLLMAKLDPECCLANAISVSCVMWLHGVRKRPKFGGKRLPI
jgi:hypothetical protein